MTLFGRRVAVSIPDTVLEEKESLREKTAKLGLVARACAIYGVDLVEIFEDPRGGGEGGLIRKVLDYLETPQYLRRRVFPLDESLKYAGALPPLRIPSHKPRVAVGDLRVGDVREGVSNGDGTVDVGLEVAPRMQPDAPRGRRTTVRIASLDPLVAEPISRERAGRYWGYRVELNPAASILDDKRFKLKIATSRLGTPLGEALGPLRGALDAADGVKMIFGSPTRGLFELLGGEIERKATLTVNLFPGQEVETVRTEEAIFAGLGLLGTLGAEKA